MRRVGHGCLLLCQSPLSSRAPLSYIDLALLMPHGCLHDQVLPIDMLVPCLHIDHAWPGPLAPNFGNMMPQVIKLGAIAAPMFSLKGPAMIEARPGSAVAGWRLEGRGAISCPPSQKKKLINQPSRPAQGKHPPAFPLKHQQKDLRLVLELGQQSGQVL